MAKRGRKKGSTNSSKHRKAISRGLSAYWKSAAGRARKKNCKRRGCPKGGRKSTKRRTTSKRRKSSGRSRKRA